MWLVLKHSFYSGYKPSQNPLRSWQYKLKSYNKNWTFKVLWLFYIYLFILFIIITTFFIFIIIIIFVS